MSRKKNKTKTSTNNAANHSNIKPNDAVTTYNVSKSHTVHDNTFEEFILINVSKAIIIYRDHIQNRTDSSTIFSWSSVALSCLIAVVSSDFERAKALHESLPSVLTFVFVAGIVYSSIVAIKQTVRFVKHRAKYTEETFIAELKLKRDSIDTIDVDNKSQLSELTSIWQNK